MAENLNNNVIFAEGEAVSLEAANEHAPEVVKAVIDREVIKIRPHLTPLYTLGSKHTKRVGAKQVKEGQTSPEIYYDEIQMLPLVTKVKSMTCTTSDRVAELQVENPDLIATNETLIFKGIPGYLEDGATKSNWLQAYVRDRKSDGTLIISPVNGKGPHNTFETVPAGTRVIRGARTGSEKQSRTAPLMALPVQRSNYMQKMLIETEETTFFRWAQTNADVKWNRSDQTEFAIAEHKRTTETDILLGTKRKIKVPNKYNQEKPEETYFQEGIFWQAGRDFTCPDQMKAGDLITMMKNIFTGNNSSNTKIALLGSDLMEAIHKIEYNQVIFPGKQKQALGLDFSSIIYGQYTLLLLNEPAFDDLDMAGYGLVIDEEYLYKYCHPWRSIALDNLKNGESDSRSQVFIDTFCYVLKNANAHCRIKLESEKDVYETTAPKLNGRCGYMYEEFPKDSGLYDKTHLGQINDPSTKATATP